jgi:hypothetical protein
MLHCGKSLVREQQNRCFEQFAHGLHEISAGSNASGGGSSSAVGGLGMNQF